MSKILLVEDDNNLREIYEARLMAEGYTIVTAPDGEAALAIASQEKPDLVISDVMMPNISGFDMLDIMRNTNGLKQVHVIMLTALSQAEDQARADALGADRYLVKSQVTLEDIVNNAKVLLGDVEPETPAAPEPATIAAAPVAVAAAPIAVAEPTPVAVAPEPTPVAVEPTPVAVAPEPVAPTPQPITVAPEPTATPIAVAAEPVLAQPAPVTSLPPVEPPVAQQPVYAAPEPVTEPVAAPQPVAAPEPIIEPAPVATPQPVAEPAAPQQPVYSEPVTSAPEPTPVPQNPDNELPQTTASEEAAMRAQIEQFISQPTPQPAPAAEEPAPQPVAATSAPAVSADVIAPTVTAPQPAAPEVAPASQPAAPAPEVIQPTPAPAPAPVVQPDVITPTTAPAPTAAEQNDAAMNKAVEQLNAAAADLPHTPSPTAKTAVGGNKVIQPISDPTVKPDIHQLLADEEAREQGQAPAQTVQPQQQQTGPRPEDIAL